LASETERTPPDVFAVEAPLRTGVATAGAAAEACASAPTTTAAAAARKNATLGRGRLLTTDEAREDSCEGGRRNPARREKTLFASDSGFY
jgi:hypothetical protein